MIDLLGCSLLVVEQRLGFFFFLSILYRYIMNIHSANYYKYLRMNQSSASYSTGTWYRTVHGTPVRVDYQVPVQCTCAVWLSVIHSRFGFIPGKRSVRQPSRQQRPGSKRIKITSGVDRKRFHLHASKFRYLEPFILAGLFHSSKFVALQNSKAWKMLVNTASA